jgi:hypothetical protein
MHRHYLQLVLKSLLVCVALWNATADAVIFDLKNKAKPRIKITVGDKGKKVTEVSFTVPTDQIGNSNAITAPGSIEIKVEIIASAANPLTGFLTVNSLSYPLKNTDPASTSSIPFSEISWTSQGGDIPSGSFQNEMNQDIASFQSSQEYQDFHTFSYANTMLIESGTYEGHVIYTWAAP